MSSDRQDQNGVGEHLRSVAGGDPGLARLLRESLDRLGAGVAGPHLQEMAREVLAGRTDLRQVAASDAYRGPLVEHFEQFATWYRDLEPADRDRLAEQARAHAAELAQRDD